MLVEHQRLAYGIGGLTPAEFWDSTPAEFIPYIRERIKWKEEQDKMENFRAGTIAAVIANVNRDKKRRATPYKAYDFFPSLGSGSSQAAQPQQDRLGAAQKIYNVMAAAWRTTTKGGKK
ncbi:hypothetical protein [Methanoregula sp.]|uniref:phage tail assembly protein T n=1 Tax=Methanoregula sp. TaxID=2052170 RepID=UPI003568E5AE